MLGNCGVSQTFSVNVKKSLKVWMVLGKKKVVIKIFLVKLRRPDPLLLNKEIRNHQAICLF